MNEFKKADDEDIISQASHTKLSTNLGTLYFTTTRLVWCPNNASISILSLPLKEIKGQLVSTAGSPRCMLKVIVDEDPKAPSFLFEFTHPTRARDDQGMFRENIAQILPKKPVPTQHPKIQNGETNTAHDPFNPLQKTQTPNPKNGNVFNNATPFTKNQRKKEAGGSNAGRGSNSSGIQGITEEELKQRATLLGTDKEVKSLYDNLVKTKIISEADFWESRKSLLATESLKSNRQATGIPTALPDLRPISETGDSISFQLKPTDIHNIFVEFPAVEKAFHDLVPLKMKESEFWKKYIQAKYFQQEKAMFTKYEDQEREKENQKRKLEDLDPSVDISSEYQASDGYGLRVDEALKPSKLNKSLSLIRKFNRHAALVLGTTHKSDESTEFREKMKEHLKFADLSEDSRAEPIPLRIQDQRRYFEGHLADEANANLKNDINWQEYQIGLNKWKVDLRRAFGNEKQALSVIDDIRQNVYKSSNTTEKSEQAIAQLEAVLPEPYKTEIFNTFEIVNELLRHFWSNITSLPFVRNKEKVKNIVDNLSTYKEKLRAMSEEITVSKNPHVDKLVSIINPLITPTQTAIDKNTQTQNPTNANGNVNKTKGNT
eukprot:TRINITY_DN1268_c0_g2_i4.p1 TRINITY_DN1268_c0_g2~~TRINITY_DN1268_c0_g2_i4.p1  ORF type:complete len:603 (+),score=102.14 TRINITY_DN1268_c0_g2_i4:1467-3275(+)